MTPLAARALTEALKWGAAMRAAHPEFIPLMLQARCFAFGDVPGDVVFDGTVLQKEGGRAINLPYPVVFYELNVIAENGSVHGPLGVLLAGTVECAEPINGEVVFGFRCVKLVGLGKKGLVIWEPDDPAIMSGEGTTPEEAYRGNMVSSGILTTLIESCHADERPTKFKREKVTARRFGAVPHNSYSIVNLNRPREREVHDSLAGHAHGAHRLHEVRGHPRKLASGRVVWVRPHKRGDAALGVVVHDYVYKGDKN